MLIGHPLFIVETGFHIIASVFNVLCDYIQARNHMAPVFRVKPVHFASHAAHFPIHVIRSRRVQTAKLIVCVFEIT